MIEKMLFPAALVVASPLAAQTNVATPVARPAAAPSPVGIDYSTAIPTEGRWSVASTVSGGAATYYSTGGSPLVTFTCVKPSRRISIARPVAGAAPFLYVWTSSMNRSLPASFNPATGLISADLPASDPLFDALSFSRGRLVVAPSNAGALVATAYPELARLVEDCRS